MTNLEILKLRKKQYMNYREDKTQFEEVRYFEKMSNKEARELTNLTGTINKEPFQRLPRGCVLFCSASGEKTCGLWKVTYRFKVFPVSREGSYLFSDFQKLGLGDK
jgi:hypothetical protein